jgi:hypothetical protein
MTHNENPGASDAGASKSSSVPTQDLGRITQPRRPTEGQQGLGANNRALPKIKARRLPEGDWNSIYGREAQTLLGLDRADALGLPACDFPSGPPFRLSAYIYELRRLGFPIRTGPKRIPAAITQSTPSKPTSPWRSLDRQPEVTF